jgi:hypothetical protein
MAEMIRPLVASLNREATRNSQQDVAISTLFASSPGRMPYHAITSSSEAIRDMTMYLIAPPAYNRAGWDIRLNIEGAIVGYWNRGSQDVNLFFTHADGTRSFPTIPVGAKQIYTFSNGFWILKK